MPSGSYDEEIPGSIDVQMGSWSSDNQALGLIDVPPLWFEQNYQQDAIGKYFFQRLWSGISER